MTDRTILIVDDSPIARRILKSCLPTDRSYTLFEADDGDAGLVAFREHLPEITFLDMTMRRVNGLDCLAAMRSSNPNAVIVVATADIQTQVLRRALDLGAMEMLRKPPTKESMRAVLERAESTLSARGEAGRGA